MLSSSHDKPAPDSVGSAILRTQAVLDSLPGSNISFSSVSSEESTNQAQRIPDDQPDGEIILPGGLNFKIRQGNFSFTDKPDYTILYEQACNELEELLNLQQDTNTLFERYDHYSRLTRELEKSNPILAQLREKYKNLVTEFEQPSSSKDNLVTQLHSVQSFYDSNFQKLISASAARSAEVNKPEAELNTDDVPNVAETVTAPELSREPTATAESPEYFPPAAVDSTPPADVLPETAIAPVMDEVPLSLEHQVEALKAQVAAMQELQLQLPEQMVSQVMEVVHNTLKQPDGPRPANTPAADWDDTLIGNPLSREEKSPKDWWHILYNPDEGNEDNKETKQPSRNPLKITKGIINLIAADSVIGLMAFLENKWLNPNATDPMGKTITEIAKKYRANKILGYLSVLTPKPTPALAPTMQIFSNPNANVLERHSRSPKAIAQKEPEKVASSPSINKKTLAEIKKG